MLDVSNKRSIADRHESEARGANPAQTKRQTVLVFQGGGALGAYQAGVYQALHEAGIEPDWIIGTSIGAINACLIAGNEPENRLDQARGVLAPHAAQGALGPVELAGAVRHDVVLVNTCSAASPGFFEPNPLAFLGAQYPLGKDNAGFYSTAPLEKTLDRARRLCTR